MKRREFLTASIAGSVGLIALKSLSGSQAFAADKGKKLTAKDIMKDGMPATISNYCEKPSAKNKACPGWKDKQGHCKECQFFNRDNSEATYKGKKYAHCQLLTDATKPQYVSENGWCNTFTKKMS